MCIYGLKTQPGMDILDKILPRSSRGTRSKALDRSKLSPATWAAEVTSKSKATSRSRGSAPREVRPPHIPLCANSSCQRALSWQARMRAHVLYKTLRTVMGLKSVGVSGVSEDFGMRVVKPEIIEEGHTPVCSTANNIWQRLSMTHGAAWESSLRSIWLHPSKPGLLSFIL